MLLLEVSPSPQLHPLTSRVGAAVVPVTCILPAPYSVSGYLTHCLPHRPSAAACVGVVFTPVRHVEVEFAVLTIQVAQYSWNSL